MKENYAMEELDDTDIQLLKLLGDDSEITIKELANRVNLSSSPVFERVKRLKTNTPLQALVMMNDPQVNEAARVLAESLIDDEAGIEKAFRLIICRKASDKEINLLNDYYRTEKDHFNKNLIDAEELISIGEFKHKNAKDKASLAAMIEVIMTIYNMNTNVYSR